MEIEFESIKTDYKNFYKLRYRNKLQKNIVSIILIPLMLGYAFAGQPFKFSSFVYGVIISALLLIGIFYLVPYLISLKRIDNSISKDPNLLGKKKITITDEGLYFKTITKNGTWEWESFVSVDSNNDFIFLSLSDKRICIIPKRAFLTDNDVTNFIGIIQAKLTITRGAINSLPGKADRKPPYLLGLICLIPIIGAFVGFAFIILGATRFKDKWFTVIGAFGVAFTFIVYSILYQTSKHSTVFRNGFKELSKSEVSNLVKDIEFYKIQNGNYPDSLKQLQSDDKKVSIYDPIQASQERKNSLFIYMRVDDKYKLFSSGEDGIPYTSDDLYPQVSAKVTGKIGLMKYELKADTSKQKIRGSTKR